MAPETVRQRLLQPDTPHDEPDINTITDEERSAIDSVIARNKSTFNVSTIGWMIAGIMVFNYTDFANVLVNDVRVNSPLLKIGAGLISVNLLVGVYMVVYLSYIKNKRDWTSHTHPALIPVATLFACVGLVLCTVALWPVWGFLTLPILFTLFMGLVMLATLLPV